ncbi:chitin deacetylase [Rhizophlyctis rosea]|nr:chitin deacetylase [Rhizophlyctis rosea]
MPTASRFTLFTSVCAVLLSASVSGAPDSSGIQIPPPIPARWPANTQLAYIEESLLQDKLVQDAWAHVQKVVRKELLDIKPSTYIQYAQVTYNDNPATAGYKARRLQDTADFKADVYSCKGQNEWGLTYDDGPTYNVVGGKHVNDTGAIRDRLGVLGVKATFFACGTAITSNPNELKASYDAGHEIAVHTWTHHPITSLTNLQLIAEVKYTEALIYSLIGKVPNQFRPPYGDIDDRCRAILSALGYNTIIWDKDSMDASLGAAQQTPTKAEEFVKGIQSWWTPGAGFISLQHDISPFVTHIATTVLDWLIGLKNQGQSPPLQIKTVGQCIGVPYYRDGTSGPGTTPVTTTTAAATSTVTTTPTQAATSKNAASGTSVGMGLAGALSAVLALLPLW